MSEIGSILREYDLLRGLSSGSSYRELQRSMKPGLMKRIRDRVKYTGARTPRPETMFRDMIMAGEVRVIRRRGKCPLVVPVKKKAAPR